MRLPELTFIQDHLGRNYLDVRGLDYIPIKDISYEYSYVASDLTFVLFAPDRIVVKEDQFFMYQPRLKPVTASELSRTYSTDIKNLVELLVNQVKNLELEKAELLSNMVEIKSGLRAAQARDGELEAKAKRRLESYRRKLQKAQAVNDLTAASQMDQRIRALEALLND
ncbi:hypothetical protein AB0G06_43440 [Nonomuraea dietziae]|uniref:hypothetical protein n=1 Tax=Nonomuraea dietziae TaxID=65515 RepID=UPI0033FA10A4